MEPKTNNIDKTNLIESHLTEYRALREEQKTRMTMNGTMMNLILLIVGAVVAAYVQMTISGKGQYISTLLILSPLLTTPITLFYYDNQLMVYRIGRYFSTALYPNIQKVVGPNTFGWEQFHQDTSGQLALVSLGRNLFFVLITIGPILVFAVLKVGYQELLALLPSHPIAAWVLITEKIALWESWLLYINAIFLLGVIITWIHSGLYFLGFRPFFRLKKILEWLKNISCAKK